MISRDDLERLLHRETGENPVLSLFLDMSVDSNSKRTHRVFLAQKQAQYEELRRSGPGMDRRALDEVLEKVDEWLEEEFDEENKGVVLYAEIGGGWFEALQFPVPVHNRFVIDRRPVIAPLAQVLESYHHHGVVLLDREHVRILSVYLGTLLDEIAHRGEPLEDIAHDLKAGGYSQSRYQRHKMEETNRFFRDFSDEVESFVRREEPDDLVVLGTDENVALFLEFLPERLQEMVIHTGPAQVDQPASEILEQLAPHLEAERERESMEILEQVRERVGQDYLATAGFNNTLMALQEGKVDTLVIAQDQEVPEGSRCPRCGFLFASEVDFCPFDGAPTSAGVDVVEEAIRMAESQGADVEFVAAGAADDLRGVGALLRFQ